MPAFIDQLNRMVPLDHFPPKRIVSIVPSITELLFDLGLDNEVCGVTRFCIHPIEKNQRATRIGGTKKVDIDKVLQLKPDLIIGNKEENTEKDVERLSAHCPIWISDVHDFESAIQLIAAIGEITDRKSEAAELTNEIQMGFSNLKCEILQSAAYLIWKDPIMVAGCDTFISDMLSKAGYANVFSDRNRYPVTDLSEISRMNPDMVLLSSEPYPFTESDVATFKSSHGFKDVMVVDGTYFSWYGSRMRFAPSYFNGIRVKNHRLPTS